MADGLIRTCETSTAAGSEISTAFGCAPGTGLVGASLPQPLPWDWSISWTGPQPNGE